MKKLFLAALGLVALSFGFPYAGVAIHLLVGTNTAVLNEADGTQSVLTTGPGSPQPDWLPRMPRSIVLTAARWAPSPKLREAGGVDVITHASLDDIKRHYRQELERLGFTVEDDGLGLLDPHSASLLGMAGTLLAERRETGHEITLQIRTPDNALLLRPRVLQLSWRQIWPGQQSPLAEYRAMRDARRAGRQG